MRALQQYADRKVPTVTVSYVLTHCYDKYGDFTRVRKEADDLLIRYADRPKRGNMQRCRASLFVKLPRTSLTHAARFFASQAGSN